MKKMSENIKKDWIIVALMILTLAVSLYFYPQLPDRMPSHWNIKGEIDGYSNKLFGVLGLNLMNIAFYFMFVLLPFLDPKKDNYTKFRSAYNIIRYTFHLFFIVMQFVIIASSIGYKVNVGMIVGLGISIMFILFGNVMGKIKHNYFVGIRTPWTLADETVWIKTHRLAAPLWVAGGIAVGILSFFNGTIAFIGLIMIICIISIIPIVYSYLYYKRINHNL